jgi:hypothetical protein
MECGKLSKAGAAKEFCFVPRLFSDVEVECYDKTTAKIVA